MCSNDVDVDADVDVDVDVVVDVDVDDVDRLTEMFSGKTSSEISRKSS